MFITNKDKLKQFYSEHRVWQGIPGIERTKGGRTFISFYSGQTAETYGNFALLIKSDSDGEFSEPIAAVKKEGKFRCFDPVLWIDPLDRLWFIWNVMPGEEVFASICENPDADTLKWSKEFYIGRGIMMNKPVVLSSGEWLFPIAIWKKDIYATLRKKGMKPDDIEGAYVYKTSDNGKNFVKLGMADIRDRSFDEHMVIELESGMLMMLVRTNYGIGVSYSYDRGKNWSFGEDSGLGGPCSRFYISRLRSGRILLINHHNFTGRNNLTALLSEDDGKTFPYSLLLDERNKVAYPDATESEDGYIYITYDRERGCFKNSLDEVYTFAREILTAKITEQDIIDGELNSKDGFLKNVVCKLGKLSPTDPDPYGKTPEDIEEFATSIITEGGDIIEKIVSRYPVNCIDFARLDSKKLDSLIEKFNGSGANNKKLLLKIIDLIHSTQTSKTNQNPIVERIMTYIQAHMADNISISEIAKNMNISIYYLSHLFKSVTGINVVEYINEMRLTKAKQMLISTEKPIKEIAIECGFNTASYFSEVFSRSEKISPTEFRKYHKKIPT